MEKIKWDAPAESVLLDINPEPPNADYGYLRTRDGKLLRNGIFWPETAPRATLVLMTGYSEFIEKYFETIIDFQNLGYCVVLPEWRGHGLSEGNSRESTRLHIERFDQNIEDLEDRHARLMAHCPKPHFALAHSMGGQISLRAAARHSDWWAALAQSAPMHGLKLPASMRAIVMGVSWLYILLGRGDSWNPLIKPAVRPGEAASNIITTDYARYQRGEAHYVANPQLQVNGPSLAWMHTCFAAMADTMRPRFLRGLQTPLFIGSAEREKIVDNRAHAHVLAHVPHGQGQNYAGAMHELLMEKNQTRQAFIKNVTDFFQNVQLH